MDRSWTDLIADKLHQWYITGVKILPNLAVALLVMVCFVFLARWGKLFMNRLLTRFTGTAKSRNLFSTIFYIIILFIGIFIALDVLKLDKAVSSLLAGAGILGLALGFAFQDLSSNFISGIYITFKRPFEVGHTVETNGFLGNIEDIQLRSTVIRSFAGLHIMIPNKDIFQKPLINYSLTPFRRIELSVVIDANTDLAKAVLLARQAVGKAGYLFKEKPVEVYCTDFQDNSVKLAIWFWIDNHQPPGYMVARHEAIQHINQAFRENRISLIVPVNVLHNGLSPAEEIKRGDTN